MTLRALDLFCKAGGATKGLQMAGFHVTGVDIEPQPRYCGDEFLQMDVMALSMVDALWDYDLIWASPPCQAHCALKVMHNAKSHADYIPNLRKTLAMSGTNYIIENVVGAPLRNPITLCGTMFNLGVQIGVSDELVGAYDWREVRRHRLFECSFPISQPNHRHRWPVIGIYGDHARDRRRLPGKQSSVDFRSHEKRINLARTALGTPWMNWKECSQAIPPAYSHYIAQEFLKWRSRQEEPK